MSETWFVSSDTISETSRFSDCGQPGHLVRVSDGRRGGAHAMRQFGSHRAGRRGIASNGLHLTAGRNTGVETSINARIPAQSSTSARTPLRHASGQQQAQHRTPVTLTKVLQPHAGQSTLCRTVERTHFLFVDGSMPQQSTLEAECKLTPGNRPTQCV